MKLFLILVFAQLTSLSMAANASTSHKTGPFYLLCNAMIIFDISSLVHSGAPKMEKYQNWLKKKENDWKRVKTSELEDLGIKEGMKIQYTEWKTKEKKEFTIKKDTYLAMIGNEQYPGDNTLDAYRTFYLVLNDNITGLDIPEVGNADLINGVAYIGQEYTIKNTPESHDYIYKTNATNVKSLPSFLEGVDSTVLEKPEGMHRCYTLKIYKDQKMKEFQLMCDTGGC